MNMYIKAMELGFNTNDGLQYHQVKTVIEEDVSNKMSKQKEYAFITWFLKNFIGPSSEGYNIESEGRLILKDFFTNRESGYRQGRYLTAYNDATRGPFYMKGETVKQYLDYLELKESREQSQQAYKISLISIGIAVVSIISSIVVPLFTSTEIPEAPFDVRVVENSEVENNLKQENDSLVEQLAKAKLYIEVMEKEDQLNINKK